ncbi:hypothetical protein [Lysinibacillus sp. 54212]|uniref:hypothetical protein n=1 Tax=Lysinibacillus sp. 54212 TaxID=3119829 RepID=UPI002FCB1EDA
MWLNILLALIAFLGLYLMWFSIYGKKRDIESIYTGSTSSFIEFIVTLAYTFSPTIMKRVITFLLGLLVAVFCTIGALIA